MVVVGLCAAIDAAAVVTLMLGADTVENCGAAKLLGTLEMLAWLGYGIIPMCIAFFAAGSACLIPELRNPKSWLGSAAVLSFLAVADVIEGHPRFPTPSNPAFCEF
jgi:hypothetical protein